MYSPSAASGEDLAWIGSSCFEAIVLRFEVVEVFRDDSTTGLDDFGSRYSSWIFNKLEIQSEDV